MSKTYTALLLLLIPPAAVAQSDTVGFESDRWELVDAELAHRFGKECLSGTAILPDVEFENGVIEVDLAVGEGRSYPGIVFRVQSHADYERFYIRPHRAGLYPDALQYTPIFNQVAGWQLYNGSGYTAAAEIPKNEWIRVRMEVKGSQATVYLGNAGMPALEITQLKHGVSRGSIGVLGPKDASACFSNFSYTVRDDLEFADPPTIETPPGTIMEWEISRPYKTERVNRTSYPGFYAIFGANWQPVAAEAAGLVDIARHTQRSEGGPDLVLARTRIRSDRKQNVKFSFGYSDEVDLFLNGRKVFSGNSSYQYRDPSFLGIVGLHDAVNLTLEQGLNEIFMMVSETFGGWGIMGRLDREFDLPIREHGRTEKVWETADTFLTPESVLYDPERDVLYVTSFDAGFASTPDSTGYLSQLSLDGEIVELEWITNLNAPTGMGIHGDNLYLLERGILTEIDIDRGEIAARYPIPGSDFANDLAIDEQGNIYISDTSPASHIDSRIYRFKNGEFEVWLDGPEINRANGLFIHENTLLVGNSGDGMLKAVDLSDKTIRDIVSLSAGVIDGIRVDTDGNYLVSHWEGQAYVVSPSGHLVEVLNTMDERKNSADFEFIRERSLLLIPTFLGNSVAAYRVESR
jgi:sugar lactone lactonase YvrE